jgi:hypothetical protein
MCCGIIPISLPLGELRCFRVYDACEWLCGTRMGSGSFRLKRQREASSERQYYPISDPGVMKEPVNTVTITIGGIGELTSEFRQ